MIEVYRQPKLRKFRQIGIVLSVLFLIGGIYILLFQESNEYSLFTIIYPILMLLEIYYNQYYPYITLTDNCLTKRLFFKQYKIQLDEDRVYQKRFWRYSYQRSGQDHSD